VIDREPFGVTRRGEDVARYTLTNHRGSRARLITLGATLTELWVPDRDGRLGDVVLGFDALEAYERDDRYFGCTVGRVANRIAGASFSLDGIEHALAANHGPHHLHGGRVGFDKAVWTARELEDRAGPALRLSHRSPDGEEGYPGAVDVSVTFRLDDGDALSIEYRAKTDAPTPVNLTNHSYWNLSGAGDVLAHGLVLHAEHFTEVDAELIPTGRIAPVAGTPLDFRHAKAIGRDIAGLEPGYDHNLVLADGARAAPAPAVEVSDPASGRRIRMSTTEPSVQLYTANYLDGVAGKGGAVYGRHAGLCLEAQHFPDAVHQPHFPSVVLRPGETYRQVTVYDFGSG